jgi:hypothetical protein
VLQIQHHFEHWKDAHSGGVKLAPEVDPWTLKSSEAFV